MKLLIVSNRLPVTAVQEKGYFLFKDSVGGLATGLKAYINAQKERLDEKFEYTWFGWPGLVVEKEDQENLKHKLFKEYCCYPIFLEAERVKNFYAGFCNETLWPLFHFFPSKTVYEETYWEEYKAVNELYFESLIPYLNENDTDTIWIHDYHLLLLPKLIRERFPRISIGFFLHIPFPSYEIFRVLPGSWRKEILLGMLGADVLGFHTSGYTQDFLKCIMQVLGVENEQGTIALDNRIIKADCFPMGIDFNSFQEESLKRQSEAVQLREVFPNKKLILSIDRLDYTKGILNRLEAFEQFLKKSPVWHEKVILMLIVVPSRTDVEEYKNIKVAIDKLVGKINGDFSKVNWQPIVYHYREFSFSELVTFYSASDVALITPLRDGMNLIAKEYLASKVDKLGVLILSEMTGASEELEGAEIVNPNSIDELVASIQRSLSLSESDQIERNTEMQKRVSEYDIHRWTRDFLQTLKQIKAHNNAWNSRTMSEKDVKELSTRMVNSKSSLIIMDYDGTLVPFFRFPELAVPATALVNVLYNISEFSRVKLLIVTGRDRFALDQWFPYSSIDLVAEHGAWIRESNCWRKGTHLDSHWKEGILSLLNEFRMRLPGSFIEEKEFSVVWHFRNANQELADIRVTELHNLLSDEFKRLKLQIVRGIKSIEICNKDVSKARGIKQFLDAGSYDFITCFGDDETDEEVFKILSENAITIKVGIGNTSASFNLSNSDAVVKLLLAFNNQLQKAAQLSV